MDILVNSYYHWHNNEFWALNFTIKNHFGDNLTQVDINDTSWIINFAFVKMQLWNKIQSSEDLEPSDQNLNIVKVISLSLSFL